MHKSPIAPMLACDGAAARAVGPRLSRALWMGWGGGGGVIDTRLS